MRCFCAKVVLGKHNYVGENAMSDRKLDLMEYKRNVVCPNSISGIADRVRIIHAKGAKAYPRFLVAS